MITFSKSFWFLEKDRGEIIEEALANITKTEVFFETNYSLISVGTERMVCNGKIPSELHQLMAVPYMKGHFKFPIKYGYSLVGKIIDQDIFGHVMHPHQDFCIIDKSDIYELNRNIPIKRATLASNLETAINAIWDSNFAIGDKVSVVGFGLMGSLIARVLSFFTEIELLIIDINPSKIILAKELGFDAILEEELEKNAFDISFHTSGSQQGLQSAIDCVNFEGKVIEVSWYGTNQVSLYLGGMFHTFRKQIISSNVSTISPRNRYNWDKEKLMRFVFNLLKRSEFDKHITNIIPFESLPKFFEKLLDDPITPGLGYVVDYARRS